MVEYSVMSKDFQISNSKVRQDNLITVKLKTYLKLQTFVRNIHKCENSEVKVSNQHKL